MLKVMIVDDEYIVREGLRNEIAWEDYGYIIIGEAENGEDALEQINNMCPDILLTDIKMPVMDGIELIKRIRELELNIKVIILTCYDEFQYAQQAIHYGVEEYILKLSSKPAEILEVFERVKKKILAEQRNKGPDYSSAIIPYFDKMLFYYQPIQTPGFFVCAELTSHLRNGSLKLEYEKEVCLLKTANSLFQGIFYRINGKNQNMYVTYIPNEDIFYVKFLCQQFCQTVKERLSLVFTMGISNLCTSIYDEIEMRMNEAKVACEYKFYDQNRMVYLFSEIKYRSVLINIDETKIEGYLESFSCQSLKKYAESFLENIKYSQIDDFINYCIEFISVIIRYLKKNNISVPENFRKVENIIRYLWKFNTYSTLSEEIFHLIDIFFELLEKSMSENKLIIRKIKDIIDKEYSSELTLEMIAKEVNISYNYLSSLFKSEVGYSFKEYLNIQRINKAKELLRQGKDNIYLISENVGYSNPYYFSRVFKKYAHVTPSEYRNKFGV